MNFKKFDNEEDLDIRIYTTISGRILIGELLYIMDDGIEIQNVFQIDNNDPFGMVPLHPDSIMGSSSVILFDSAIETETPITVETRSRYIDEIIKYMVIKTQKIESTNPKKTSKKNNGNNNETGKGMLFNWRNKFN